MFTTRLFFRWQKMLLKMKVLYCPKLPQRPKLPHLTVVVISIKHFCQWYINVIQYWNHQLLTMINRKYLRDQVKVALLGWASSWWRHQMETFSTFLVICVGNSLVPGEFSTKRPVTQSFDVYFDLCPNKQLSKQSWGWWFETQSCPLWRHRNDC